jgi:hypothetical protein
MSKWTSKPQQTEVPKIEIEGVSAMCRMCPQQADKVIYLPEVKALTWKCSGCDFINIIEDFDLV